MYCYAMLYWLRHLSNSSMASVVVVCCMLHAPSTPLLSSRARCAGVRHQRRGKPRSRLRCSVFPVPRPRTVVCRQLHWVVAVTQRLSDSRSAGRHQQAISSQRQQTSNHRLRRAVQLHLSAESLSLAHRAATDHSRPLDSGHGLPTGRRRTRRMHPEYGDVRHPIVHLPAKDAVLIPPSCLETKTRCVDLVESPVFLVFLAQRKAEEAVAYVLRTARSWAQLRASPTDRPQSEQTWCSQVMGGRPHGLRQFGNGGTPSQTSIATRRVPLAGTLSDIRGCF